MSSHSRRDLLRWPLAAGLFGIAPVAWSGVRSFAQETGEQLQVIAETALRAAPAVTGVERGTLAVGTVVTLAGDAVDSGGVVWRPVTVNETGAGGWVNGADLRPFGSAAPALLAEHPGFDRSGSLIRMLDRLPYPPGPVGVPYLAGYSDFSRQFAAMEIDPAADLPAVSAAVLGLFRPWQSGDLWSRETSDGTSWESVTGFGYSNVDQLAETQFGEHDFILILRGRFDPPALVSKWVDYGYQRLESTVADLYRYRDPANPEFDVGKLFDLELGGRYNVATFLDDETIAFSRTLEAMTAVLEVASGERPSIARDPGVAQLLLTTSDELTSAGIADGGRFAFEADPVVQSADTTDNPVIPGVVARLRAGMEAESPRMPPIRLALFGATAAGAWEVDADSYPDRPSDSRLHLHLLVASPAQVDAANQALANRWPVQSSLIGVPYAAWFEPIDSTTGDPWPVSVMQFGQTAHGRWLHLLANEAFRPIFWYLEE